MLKALNLIGFKGHNLCFAGMIEAVVDFTKKPTDPDYIRDKKGLKIKVFGQSEDSKDENECGNNAIKNIAPGFLSDLIDNPFEDLFENLDRIGYKRGLTYQTLPYNFIKSFQNNELKKYFASNLERLYNLSGKQVSIIAHSFGNLNTSYQLSLLTQEFKDKYIKAWISVAPPLLGAMTATQSVLAGLESYQKAIFGLKYPAASQSLGSFPSMYELMQVNMYTIYQNEPWFQWVKKRLDYEAGNIDFEDSGMLFWPKIDEKCTPDSFENISENCHSGLFDMRKEPSITVENGKVEYFLDDNEKLISDLPMLDTSLDYFRMFNNDDFRKLRNPGVPVQMIYSKSTETISKLKYKNKITDYTKDGKYPEVEYENNFGDGTVGANSALFPAIKWAYQFNHKNQISEEGVDFKVNFGKFLTSSLSNLWNYVVPTESKTIMMA